MFPGLYQIHSEVVHMVRYIFSERVSSESVSVPARVWFGPWQHVGARKTLLYSLQLNLVRSFWLPERRERASGLSGSLPNIYLA
jgi:hypothetical protein